MCILDHHFAMVIAFKQLPMVNPTCFPSDHFESGHFLPFPWHSNSWKIDPKNNPVPLRAQNQTPLRNLVS